MATHVSREHLCRCPECDEVLIHKQGRIVTSHFAHHARTACYLSEGESERHMQMKIQLGQWFGHSGRSVEYEKRVLSYRRADLIVGGAAVVECQASAISIEEIEERTQDYNDHAAPVMWVWDSARLFGKRARLFPSPFVPTYDCNEPPEYRIPAEIRHLAEACDNRLFVLDGNGVLALCFLGQPSVRSSEWYDEDGELQENYYRPKTLKSVWALELPHATKFVPFLGHYSKRALHYVRTHIDFPPGDFTAFGPVDSFAETQYALAGKRSRCG